MNPGVFYDYEARILSCLGQVEEADFNTLSDQLLRLDTQKTKAITVYLSARGGNLMDGLKVMDVLATLRSPTVGIGMGLNEGASTLILSAMNSKMMLPSAVLFPARLWDFPNQPARVGLHSVTTTSLQTHLHRRLDEIVPQWPHLVRLARESEKQPHFIPAAEALRLGLIDEILGQTEFKNRTRGTHVR